jgi:hypothetical protein
VSQAVRVRVRGGRKLWRGPCAHCGRCRYLPSRGHCSTCYKLAEVRATFGASKYARKGKGDFCGRGTRPTPTDAEPGSERKLSVLEARAQAGQELFHDQDRGRG